jgi:hypothetical protein
VVFLVQLIVPLYDNSGAPFARGDFTRIRRELTEHFGGATAYTRAPAEGTWEDSEGRVHHDDVVVIEVMVETLERAWWAAYRREVGQRFRQHALVIRATEIQNL